MAKRKQPDSPLTRTLYDLLFMDCGIRCAPEGEAIWKQIQGMVTEAGGISNVTIGDAEMYCLLFGSPFARREGRWEEALAYVNDYLTHPSILQSDLHYRAFAHYLAGEILLEMERYPEAIAVVQELMSEKFDNNNERRGALGYVGHILWEFLSPEKRNLRDEQLPHGCAEVVERWAKRWKRSTSSQRWLPENPTLADLRQVMKRVWPRAQAIPETVTPTAPQWESIGLLTDILNQLDDVEYENYQQPEIVALWNKAKGLVEEAGGVHQIPIEAASHYCLWQAYYYSQHNVDCEVARSYLEDYIAHPDVAADDVFYYMWSRFLAGVTFLGLQRPDDALKMAEELMSERFAARKTNRAALENTAPILWNYLSPDGKSLYEGSPSAEWASLIERWAKRWKGSKATRPWLPENPTMQDLWNLMQRVQPLDQVESISDGAE